MKNDTFPPANGVPMHLLTERGLNRSFIKVVEEHRRDGRPVVTDRDGQPALVPAEQLENDVRAARRRIAEIDAEIAQFQRSFSLNEAPPSSTSSL
jgi:hypothetical protein